MSCHILFLFVFDKFSLKIISLTCEKQQNLSGSSCRNTQTKFWFSGLKQLVLASCTSVMQEYVKYLLFILLLLPPLNQLNVLCLFNFLARWISFLKMWTFRVKGDSFYVFWRNRSQKSCGFIFCLSTEEPDQFNFCLPVALEDD